MYALFSKREAAHDDGIWTCAWGRRPERKVNRAEAEEGKEEANAEAETGQEEVIPAEDIIVTAGVDDIVHVWTYDDGELKLKHKFSEHSLGVVSVALNSDASCE